MELDERGLLRGVSFIPSPNFDERPEGISIDLIVIHNISLPPGEYGGNGVVELFTNSLVESEHPYYTGIAGLRVSSHFFVRRNGEIVQFVPTTQRAWHAGISSFRGREKCNDFSIGIELEGSDFSPFSEEQYDSLKALTLSILEKHPQCSLAGHAEISPGRKTDPGPFFDWNRYRSSIINLSY